MNPRCLPVLCLVGCLEASTTPPAEFATAHFDCSDIEPDVANWFEQQVAGAELYLGEDVIFDRARLRGVGHGACPPPYCTDEVGISTIACSTLEGDCPAHVAAWMADQLGPSSRLLRDGLVEVLAGGIGDADVFFGEIDRETIDVDNLLEDARYDEAERTTTPFRWLLKFQRPGADLVRHLLEQDRARFLRQFRGAQPIEAAELEAWRSSPARRGRGYRLPFAECAPERSIDEGLSLVTPFIVSPLYAPDVDEQMWMVRAAVASFEVPFDTLVRVQTLSGVGATAYFRVEPCGDVSAPRFVVTRDEANGPSAVGEARLPAGRYFIVAGSDGSPAAADERISLTLQRAAP